MKKMLFICPSFFDYHTRIKTSIEKNNIMVDWMDDRPKTNIFEKCVLRVKPKLLQKKVNRYFYKDIMTKVKKENYDIVFVIFGQSFNSLMFKEMKKTIPNAKFILYLWDSVENFPNLEDLSTAFDYTYSFDKKDCEKYGFSFLPLFYSESNFDPCEIKYDASFVGTVKNGKLALLEKIKNELMLHNISLYYYYFLQSRIVYLYYKCKDNEFSHMRMRDFKYKRLTYSQNTRICRESKIVIDVPMKNQNGLSMRTFECLAYKRKMITTNNDIVNYEFYRPENFYVYNGKIDFDDIFFKADYVDIEENIIGKYSIDNWTKRILKEQ